MEKFNTVNIDKDQVVFLLSYNSNAYYSRVKKVEEALALLVKRLEEKYSLKVNIGIGARLNRYRIFTNHMKKRSISLPIIQSWTTGSIYKYQDQNQEGNFDYYYPIELELRFINAVMNGETDEVQEISIK